MLRTQSTLFFFWRQNPCLAPLLLRSRTGESAPLQMRSQNTDFARQRAGIGIEKRRLESEATADYMATAPCRHRAFKPPHCRRRWGERGNLKSRTACRRPLYSTRAKRGNTGGKVRFPPVLHVHCSHQVHSTFPYAGGAHYAELIL